MRRLILHKLPFGRPSVCHPSHHLRGRISETSATSRYWNVRNLRRPYLEFLIFQARIILFVITLFTNRKAVNCSVRFLQLPEPKVSRDSGVTPSTGFSLVHFAQFLDVNSFNCFHSLRTLVSHLSISQLFANWLPRRKLESHSLYLTFGYPLLLDPV